MNILTDANAQNMQQFTVGVSTSGAPALLTLLDGYLNVNWGQQGGQSYRYLLGPALAHDKFVRASGTVAFASVIAQDGATPNSWVQATITNCQADWSDEAQQVALQFEITTNRSDPNSLYAGVTLVAYHVAILAMV